MKQEQCGLKNRLSSEIAASDFVFGLGWKKKHRNAPPEDLSGDSLPGDTTQISL